MENSKIHCVGFSADKLTADQKEKLEQLVSSSPDLLGVHVFPNIDTSSDENIPSGITMFFPPSAKVDATLVSDNLFQVLCVSKVLSGPFDRALDDAHILSKVKTMGDAVEQHPKKPVTGETRHPITNKDKHTWASELGGEGSFVGAYYQLAENHRDKNYYLVARGTAPLVVQSLKDMITEKQPTYRDLIFGDEFRGVMQNAAYTAKRNVQRNLCNVAEALEVSISRMDEIGSILEHPSHSYRERAEPEWSVKTCSIRSAEYGGKPAVALYSGVVPKSDVQNLKDAKFFVVANPVDSIHVVDLTKPSELSAIPVDTGRSTKAVSSTKKVPLIEGVLCDGTRNVQDVAQEPYNKITPVMKQTFKKSGWETDNPMGVLVRVAVKVHNPSLKRNAVTVK